MSNVYELVFYKLKKGVTEEKFLAISDEINANFLALQKGYINRKLIKRKDTWADLVLWETMEDAKNALKAGGQNPAFKPFFECINPFTCKMQHLSVVKEY